MSDRNLCRGWTASDIREAVSLASEKQREVLLEIAENPYITTEEIAERLGWPSHLNVRAVLARFSSTTAAIGVKDPGTGANSWPFEIIQPSRESTFWRYLMPPEAAAVVRDSIRML